MLKIMQCISFVTFILSIQHLVFSNGQRNEAEGRIIYHPIVGGDPAEESELPHLAAVGFIRRFKQYWLCGGTLITKRYVLTAAHCLEDKKYRSYGKPVNVRLGDLDLKSSVDDSHAQNIDIMRRIPHPEYKHPMKYNDIALLELKQDAVFNNFVKPACLHRTHDIKETKAVVSGWGTAERNVTVPGQQKLRKVEIDLHPLDKCKVFLEGKDVSSILSEGLKDDSMICSGVLAGGKDSCDGDSGGPLQLAATSAECSAEIIGVVSFAFSSECGQKEVPAIYTRVSKYVPWIESITNSSG
ncbi:hypothetical protein C0J52_20870 [Blattella germanica]|nr:hypothetical protein C0J52_20870 [Blattella germanica]